MTLLFAPAVFGKIAANHLQLRAKILKMDTSGSGLPIMRQRERP